MKKRSTQTFCAQREGGWCKPLAKDAEVTLEWCRGRGATFVSCVVGNGFRRYGN